MIMGAWGLGRGGAWPPKGFRLVKGIMVSVNNTGCYIETGVYNTAAWEGEISVICGNVLNSRYPSLGAYYTGGGWNGFGVILYGNVPRIVYGSSVAIANGSTVNDGETVNNVKVAVWRDDANAGHTSVSVNGGNTTTLNVSSAPQMTGNQICLMGFGELYSNMIGAIVFCDCVIRQGGVDAAHLFPVVRLSDNTPGFYDSVQKIFRPNSGSGSLVAVEF